MHEARRAIIPAAGYGTRLRPITAVIPKEMLPVGRAPVLEHVLNEVKAAGIERALFVISPGKEMVRDYFGDGSRWGVACDYVVQREMRGLGDAILHGEAWAGDEPFAVAFGDCITDTADPTAASPLARALRVHRDAGSSATVVTECVPPERTSRYGILRPRRPLQEPASEPFEVAGVIEKPAPELAPSRQAVAARWVLDPSVFAALHKLQAAIAPGQGELGLLEAIAAMLAADRTVWAVPLLEGEARRDIGAWDTYLAAAARAALADADAGPYVRRCVAPVLDGQGVTREESQG